MNFRQTPFANAVLVTASLLLLMQSGCTQNAPQERGAIYSANEEGLSISIIDPEIGKVQTTSVEVTPHNVQISDDGLTLLAVGSLPSKESEDMEMNMKTKGRLLAFDAANVSRGVVSNIEVGIMPAHVIFGAGAKQAFVTNSGDNTLSVIDLSKREIIKTISVGLSPHGLRMSPDGKVIYVANTADGTVSVISVTKLSELARIPVGKGPVQIAFTPDGKRSYVTLRDENSAAVIDTLSQRVIAKIRVGSGPIQVFASPNGREVYVANQGVKAAPGETLSVIDTASQKVVAEIVTGAGAHGVAVSRNGNRVFVANSFANTVSVIDPVSRKVLRNVAVGRGPGGITFADGNLFSAPDFLQCHPASARVTRVRQRQVLPTRPFPPRRSDCVIARIVHDRFPVLLRAVAINRGRSIRVREQ